MLSSLCSKHQEVKREEEETFIFVGCNISMWKTGVLTRSSLTELWQHKGDQKTPLYWEAVWLEWRALGWYCSMSPALHIYQVIPLHFQTGYVKENINLNNPEATLNDTGNSWV